MLPQQIKDALFAVNRVAVLPNSLLWRARLRAQKGRGSLSVHLGCGDHYIQGMINCDGNVLRKIDHWLDLRLPLPFPDASARVVYSSHTLEHLYPEEALKLLREVRRILAPEGVARIGVPDVSYFFRIARGEATSPWPRRFAHPVGQAVNYLFCDGQHRYAYDANILTDFAGQAGFSDVRPISEQYGLAPRPYGDLMLGDEPEGTLVLELRR
jgi:prepilin-type processing-associated H-X9-DG protein